MVDQGAVAIDFYSIANFLNQVSTLQAHTVRSNMNPILDPYLHHSENPGIPLTSMILNAHNYNTWSRKMWLALKSKNKFKFTDLTIKKLDKNDFLFEARDGCNT